jgi:hypothetical protein
MIDVVESVLSWEAPPQGELVAGARATPKESDRFSPQCRHPEIVLTMSADNALVDHG